MAPAVWECRDSDPGRLGPAEEERFRCRAETRDMGVALESHPAGEAGGFWKTCLSGLSACDSWHSEWLF